MGLRSFLKKVSGYDALKRIAGSPKRQRERQYAREDTAIQRKVADAKAAGVHPLYALGASTTSGFPTQSPGSAAGQAIEQITRAIPRSAKDPGLSLVDHANIRMLDARTKGENLDQTLQILAWSERARATQESNVRQDIGTLEPTPVRKDPKEDSFVGPPRPRLTLLEDGTIIKMDPKTSTGQELEDTHGEVMGNVYGVYNEIVRGIRGTKNMYDKGYDQFFRSSKWPVRKRKKPLGHGRANYGAMP